MVQNHLLHFTQSPLSLFLGLENHCLSNSNSAFPAMEISILLFPIWK